jgi:3',5'-cyclic AMP phosphodiesterase CpdA
MPKIVVPGNHDVPLYNVFERFVRPLRKYDEFFEMEPECWFVDDGLAVAGVNTARSLVVKGGRINKEQVARVRARFGNIDDRVLKIVVSHHPFDLPDGFDDDDIVGRAAKFMPEFAGCGADVFLAGHLHVSAITTSARRYHLDSGRAALVIQAGTATSTRGRGERNSFNLLEFESPRLTIRRLEHIKGDGFVLANEETFEQTPDAGWSKI